MMHSAKRLFSALLCTASVCSAQQGTAATPPAATTGSTATMEQTIDFLNQFYREQGVLTIQGGVTKFEHYPATFQMSEACGLMVTQRIRTTSIDYKGRTSTHDGSHARVFRLDLTDPTTVSVENSPTDVELTPYYIVTVGQTHWALVPLQADRTAPPVVFEKGLSVIGTISKVDAGSWQVVSDEHQLLTLGGADMKVKLQLSDEPRKTVSFADGAVGDSVTISARNAKDVTVTLNQGSTGLGKSWFVDLASSDAATRVAKAFIHAVVLCHKDEKPSLF